MDELLNQVYHEIIYNLLIHPPNQAFNVLQNHAEVVDDDFLHVLKQTVITLGERNCQEDADFLSKLVQKVEESGSFSTLFKKLKPKATETPVKKEVNPPQKIVTPPPPSPEKESAAEHLYNQGTQQFQANQYTAAFQSWQQALQLYRELQNRRGEVNCLGKLGNVYQSLGKYKEAITCHQQALAIARQIKYRQAEANSLSSLGHVCYSLGQYDQAIEGYKQALSIAKTIQYRVGEANTLGNLGNIYYVLGKLEEAVENYQQALKIAQELNYRFGAVNFLNNLGNVYSSLEQYEQAIAYIDQALTLARTLNYRFGEAYFLSNIGKVYQAKGDDQQALVYFEQYLELVRSIQSPQMEANALHQLGNIYQIRGESKSAITHYEQSLEVHRQTQNPQGEAIILSILGKIYQDLQQTDKAIEDLQNCLKIATPKALPMECLAAGHHLGDLGLSTYNWQLALEGYEQAIQAIEHICTGTSPVDVRSEIAQESRSIYSKQIQTCINLKKPEKALEFVERWRCQRRLELTDSSLFPSGEIQSHLKKYDRLQQQLQALHLRSQSDEMKQLTTAGVRLNSSATFKTESEILETLEKERQKIWEEIHRLDPKVAEQLQVTALSIDKIQALVPNETTAILNFYTTAENTYVFVIRKTEIILHTCEGEGIESLQNWIQTAWIENHQNHRREWRNQIPELLSELSIKLQFNQLISEALEDCQELIIIPHLNLYSIPFAALPIQLKDQTIYLCDRFKIRTISSCTMLNVDFQNNESTSAHSLGILEEATGGMIFIGYEAQKIAKLYQVYEEFYLSNETATASQFETLIQQVQLLYLGSSIHFSSENPLEAELKLNDCQISLGQLLSLHRFYLLEILIPDLKLECETLDFFEINMRVFNHFLERGTQRIIYPLWSLEDIATSLFIWFYYQNLQQQSSTEALRQAQIQLRTLTGQELEQVYQPEIIAYLKQQQDSEKQQKINDQLTLLAWKCQQEHPFESPYYWANFIIYGC